MFSVRKIRKDFRPIRAEDLFQVDKQSILSKQIFQGVRPRI